MTRPAVHLPQRGPRVGPRQRLAGAGLKALALTALVALVALATACQSPGDGSGAARSVLVQAEQHLAHCPLRQPAAGPGLQVLDSAAQWAAVLARPEAQVLPMPVDWASSRVLLVALGPVPTGGHRVALVARELPVLAGELQIVARHLRPTADDAVTQAFTAPCLLVLLPRAGWEDAALQWRP
jgi:hypothetical protein